MDHIVRMSYELFGETRVRHRTYDDGTVDLDIYFPENVKSINSYQPKEITVSIDSSQYIFMTIDGFSWEFDDNFDKAYREIKKYIESAASNNLIVKRGGIKDLFRQKIIAN